MKIILGASTKRCSRECRRLVGNVDASKRSYWITGRDSEGKRRKDRKRKGDRNFADNSDRVGIEKTDNLSLFDKFPPSPLLSSSHLSISYICKNEDILRSKDWL